MNDLVEVEQSSDHVCEDNYFVRLFTQGNDYAMCVNIVKEIFDDYHNIKEVLSMEDLVMEVSMYNDGVLTELTDSELTLICHECEQRIECWGDLTPWSGDWPEDDSNLEECRGGELEANWEYAAYNYNVSSIENLIVSILLDIKYCVKIGIDDWEYIYNEPMPAYLPKDHYTYFNDAQGLLIPEMAKEPVGIMGQFRLTG